MAEPYTEARKRANKKYDSKTYVTFMFYMRKEDDAEVIADIERAKAEGVAIRQWLHDLYEKAKEV